MIVVGCLYGGLLFFERKFGPFNIETVTILQKKDDISERKPAAGGKLEIESRPTGADWYLNGTYVGITPDEKGDIEPGTVRVTVKKEGY